MGDILSRTLGWLGGKGFLFVVVLLSFVALSVWKDSSEGVERINTQIAYKTGLIEKKEAEVDGLEKERSAKDGELQAKFMERDRYRVALSEARRKVQRAGERLAEIKFEYKWSWRVPFTEGSKAVTAQELKVGSAQMAVKLAEDTYLKWKELVDNHPLDEQLKSILRTEKKLHSEIGNLTTERSALVEERNASPMVRFTGYLEDNWRKAMLVVMIVIFSPMLLKVALYHVVAPVVTNRARFPPIHLIPESSGILSAGLGRGRISGVSKQVEIGPDEEILLHSDYQQSSPVGFRKNTAWLLNGALPFSSILCGMYLLTRFRTRSSESGEVTVSSISDKFSEVAVLEVPKGSAVVLQPRALEGVVQKRGESIRITKHWRLFSLHAWLTLQLRYLVFHGPCRLIVHGCRGIKLEPGDSGRMVNESATLGFCANLKYSITRCETFWSYFFGKESLFNDNFEGSPGVFICEETPEGNSGGILGRGISGLWDGLLKVFGL